MEIARFRCEVIMLKLSGVKLIYERKFYYYLISDRTACMLSQSIEARTKLFLFSRSLVYQLS